MTDLDLQLLLNQLIEEKSEQPWLEFKLNAGCVTNDGIGEYISALSNGATISNKQFGYLVWGIDNSTHYPKGTNFSFVCSKEGNQDLELWLRSYIHPRIGFKIHEFDINKRHFTLIIIPAAIGEPTNFKKKPWIRINSNKTDLRNFPHYIRQIYNSLIDWSAQIIKNASIEKDLDSSAIDLARLKFSEKKENSSLKNDIFRWDNSTFLDKSKITIKGEITNAAVILLGKPDSSHYLLPSISQITWKLDTEEKSYEHFTIPMLLSTTKILGNIRNIKYKFFPDNILLYTEVSKYDTKVILEALHNCIAHQDYSLNEKIILTEKTDKLIFENAGTFFEGIPEDYSSGDKTPSKYRNFWLSQAMVNLNMIDTVGNGIYTMFTSQKSRFFPLPDYDISNNQKVKLLIYGHSIDENYSKLLIQRKDLPLSSVILLDRVQKKLPITTQAGLKLKKEKLIEGRKPNFYVTSTVAVSSGDKAVYIKNRAFNDSHYKKLIISYLQKYKKGNRKDFEALLYDKLSDVLSDKQKKDKVKNLLQSLRLVSIIYLDRSFWKLK
jgi:ATP-dependent DNA helicase RecG